MPGFPDLQVLDPAGGEIARAVVVLVGVGQIHDESDPPPCRRLYPYNICIYVMYLSIYLSIYLYIYIVAIPGQQGDARA